MAYNTDENLKSNPGGNAWGYQLSRFDGNLL